MVNGQSFPITGRPQTVTLTGLPSDGNPVDVTASFSADPACPRTETALFAAPASCTSTTFYGLSSSGLGLASLSIDLQNHLLVSNIGTSGNDGVAVAVNANEFTMNFTEPAFPASSSATFQGIAIGFVNNTLTNLASVSLNGNTSGANIVANFTALGASMVQTDLFRQGLYIGSITAPNNGDAGFVAPCFIRFGVALLEQAGYQGPCFIVGLEHVEAFTTYRSDLGKKVLEVQPPRRAQVRLAFSPIPFAFLQYFL